MTDSYTPKRLRYSDIRAAVETFFEKFPHAREIPVPIEEIVEFDMAVDIAPTEGLMEEHQIDGFTSGDGKEILIDQEIYERSPNRARFTIAHEAGHIWLHAELFQGKSYSKIEGWKKTRAGFTDDAQRWFEYQANSFAGLVLMPSPEFNREFGPLAAEVAAKHDLPENHPFVRETVSDLLCGKFGVSARAMYWRAHREFGGDA